jgi:hypothetical protein
MFKLLKGATGIAGSSSPAVRVRLQKRSASPADTLGLSASAWKWLRSAGTGVIQNTDLLLYYQILLCLSQMVRERRVFVLLLSARLKEVGEHFQRLLHQYGHA